MVQPYLADVDAAGEAGLVYFAGEFSHAITEARDARAVRGQRTGARLFALAVRRGADRPSARPPPPNAARRSSDRRTSAQRFGPLLYARVDLLPPPMARSSSRSR